MEESWRRKWNVVRKWNTDTSSLSLRDVDVLRVRNSRHSTSSETLCVGKICSWTELFMIRGVREPRFDCICKPTESRDRIQRLCMFFPLNRPFTLFVRSSSIYLLCGVSKVSLFKVNSSVTRLPCEAQTVWCLLRYELPLSPCFPPLPYEVPCQCLWRLWSAKVVNW